MALPFRRTATLRKSFSKHGLAVRTSRLVLSTAPVQNDELQQVSFKDIIYRNPLRLPRLPIPALEDTVSRYLQSVEPLTRDRPDDFIRAKDVAGRFLSGDGPVLHSMVMDKDAAQKFYPYSYIESLWDDMYLEGRWALPVNSNPFIALKDSPKDAAAPVGSDPQIFGATKFISSFLKWSRSVRNGTFRPDVPAGCVYGYSLQGGTARVARKGKDDICYYPASRHAVVFCNNRIFRLNLLAREGNEVKQVGEDDLRKSIKEIRASALSETHGHSSRKAFIGHLTANGRDEWAKSRAALEGYSSVNRATLLDIDSALLTIALDDDDTPDFKDEARAFLTGDSGRNRWFDKHQLVVLKNGKMAVNFEHSYSDGMVWTRMLGEIWHDMYGVKANNVKSFPEAPVLSSPPPPPLEVIMKLPYEVKSDVLCAQKEFDETCKGYTLDVVDFRDFGKNSCKGWKISPDALVQMSFQLAFWRLHGAMPSTYESCSTRQFYRGRTETIRSCTSESADFVSAMGSEAKGKDTRRAILDLAAAKHVQIATAASQGQGVDRHITAMKAAAAGVGGQEKGRGSEFFDDSLTAESSGWRLSTSNLSQPWISSFGFGAVAGNGYGLGYSIDQDHITIPTTAFRAGGHTDGELMAAGVVQALREIGDACR